jgi:hypothetical protein
MCLAIDPFRLLLISLAGWLNQQQQDVISYLQEENHVLANNLEVSGSLSTTTNVDVWRSEPRSWAGACCMN